MNKRKYPNDKVPPTDLGNSAKLTNVMNTKKITLRGVIEGLLKNQMENLKSSQSGKRSNIFKGTIIQSVVDISVIIIQPQRQCSDTLKY